MTNAAPMACANRECSAPGKASDVTPSWRTRRRRCTSGVSMSASTMLSSSDSNATRPCTGSRRITGAARQLCRTPTRPSSYQTRTPSGPGDRGSVATRSAGVRLRPGRPLRVPRRPGRAAPSSHASSIAHASGSSGSSSVTHRLQQRPLDAHPRRLAHRRAARRPAAARLDHERHPRAQEPRPRRRERHRRRVPQDEAAPERVRALPRRAAAREEVDDEAPRRRRARHDAIEQRPRLLRREPRALRGARVAQRRHVRPQRVDPSLAAPRPDGVLHEEVLHVDASRSRVRWTRPSFSRRAIDASV